MWLCEERLARRRAQQLGARHLLERFGTITQVCAPNVLLDADASIWSWIRNPF
jgi:hypothetical protein